MDRRIIFFIIFTITVVSTLLVTAVSIMSGQSWLYTVIYAVVTMWVMGIISQILMQNLYHTIIQPLEEEKQAIAKEETVQLNLEDLQEIDQVHELRLETEEQNPADSLSMQPSTPPAPPKVGGNVEHTG